MPPTDVFRISFVDPHSAPWLRVLLSIDWAKRTYGQEGIYNEWEKDWLNSYPLEYAPPKLQKLLAMLRSYFPIVNDVLFGAKFSALNGKTLPSLFNLDQLHIRNLELKASSFLNTGKLSLSTSSSEHIAVFALLREKGMLSEESLDRIMTQWFVKLAQTKTQEQLVVNS